MKNGTKISLITATLLVIFGIGIMAFSLPTANRNLDVHNFSPTVTAEHTVTEAFDNINIDINTANVNFYLSEDENCHVICNEDSRSPHTASVKDNTLWIKVEDNRKWYDYINISFDTPEVEIHLPKEQYLHLYVRGDTGDVNVPHNFEFDYIDISTSTGHVSCFASASGDISISTDTGDVMAQNVGADNFSVATSTGRISVENINCKAEFSVSVDTGDAKLDRVVCGSFISTGSTGELTVTKLRASELMDIRRSTGDVDLDECDAAEIKITTDTGDVTGSFLSEKIFFTESDTGDIDVPKSTTGGICEIETDTGDIDITISE